MNPLDDGKLDWNRPARFFIKKFTYIHTFTYIYFLKKKIGMKDWQHILILGS